MEVEDEWLERKNGSTLVRVGVGREKQESFVFKGSFVEIRFVAHRFDADGIEPLDYYVVITCFAAMNGEINGRMDFQANRTLILSHAKEIEDGLLHYPPIYDYKPVKRVWFDLWQGTGPQQLVLADEINL